MALLLIDRDLFRLSLQKGEATHFTLVPFARGILLLPS
jgi:hypothetical protein